MAIQIKIRRDTKAEWDSADPVLLAGELGFELKDSATSGRFKIGNGSREWSRLPFWYAYQDSAGNYASSGIAGTGIYRGNRAIAFGGTNGNYQSTIDYFDITSTGNATDFGDLTVARYYVGGGVSDGTYGVIGPGWSNANAGSETVIDYVTIATAANASDFGDKSIANIGSGGVSDGTYGVWGSGVSQGSIDYIVIATQGNTVEFGDSLQGTVIGGHGGGMSNGTRGVFSGAALAMDYITIATPSNATDFGDKSVSRLRDACASDDTYGVMAGGAETNVIDYITIDTPSNATDFGDTLADYDRGTGTSNDTRAVFIGGRAYDPLYITHWNAIQYVTIQTPGNATDFGDLTVARQSLGATSGSPS